MYDANYPLMTQLEFEKAPWNEKEEKTEIIDATKSYSFDFTIPVTVSEESDDNCELKRRYENQYPSLEEVFEYLARHFKHPIDKMQSFIKEMSRTAIITDSFIDFNY